GGANPRDVQCCARFGARTHEWRNADPARTVPGADGDETRGLPQRDGRACGAGEGAIAGRSVLGRDLLLPRQARRQSEADLLGRHGVVLAKRLEGGKFRWPRIEDGVMRLSAAQLAALIEGLDWMRVRARLVPTPEAVQ